MDVSARVIHAVCVEGYMHRYRIRPGLTGWAQVNGYRGETSTVGKMEARVECDLFYIRNWSFCFDMPDYPAYAGVHPAPAQRLLRAARTA